MVTRYYRSVFDDLEDIRRYRERLERQMHGISPAALLPAGGEPALRMLSFRPAMFRTSVSDSGGEVVVTATGMGDGITKRDIALTLTSSRELEIRCGRTEERIAGNGWFCRNERTSFLVTEVVCLPDAVTSGGSSATFRDGVLEVRLKKTVRDPGRKISID